MSAAPDRSALATLYETRDEQRLAHGWFADGTFVAPQHMLTRLATAAGAPSWLYVFDHVPAAIRASVPGTAHGDEVGYVFGSLPGKMRGVGREMLTAEDWQVADLMAAYWTRFARHGDPNGRNLRRNGSATTTYWPRWQPTTDTTLVIRQTPQPVRHYRRRVVDYYEHLFRTRLGQHP